MRFDVVTLFPQMIQDASRYGVLGKAIENKAVRLVVWNPREFATDKHRSVDERPYGGGPGMLMAVQPLRDTIKAAAADDTSQAKVLYLSPQGQPLKQADLIRFAGLERLLLVSGRYEGIDERVINSVIDEEISLGDYVLSGGELAALSVIDGVTRLLPGVLGSDESSKQDSYMHGLLDYPHYTRPNIVDGMEVPSILLGGDHAAIKQWRLKQSLGRTWQRRPDLMKDYPLDSEQERLLNEFINEQSMKEE